MNYKQIKQMWNEQHAEGFFTFDEQSFNQHIEKRCAETQHRINCRDWTTLGIYLFTGLFLLAVPLVTGNGYHKLFGAGIFFGLAFYVLRRRQIQQGIEFRFEQNLAGHLARAVHRQRDHVRFSKSMIYWVGLPYFAFATVNFIAVQQNFSLGWYLTTLIPIPLMYLVIQLGLTRSDLPRLRELESMHAAFREENDSSEPY
ncbi:MAG: hypothetical protein ABQ298_00670 [Puniceicoccaceae bacterium]